LPADPQPLSKAFAQRRRAVWVHPEGRAGPPDRWATPSPRSPPQTRPESAAGILNVPVGEASPLLFNLIQNAQAWIPHNHVLVAFGVLAVGMITGVDGSGFAGLPLTGSLAGALGPTVGLDVVTLCAVGQMGAVWTGGGTLIAWSSLIAVAGFARVSVLDTVRALLLPVLAGLAVSTICAVVFWS